MNNVLIEMSTYNGESKIERQGHDILTQTDVLTTLLFTKTSHSKNGLRTMKTQ